MWSIISMRHTPWTNSSPLVYYEGFEMLLVLILLFQTLNLQLPLLSFLVALYFKDNVKLSPTSVQIIYLIVPIFMVICSAVSSKISAAFGRVQTIILVKCCGLGFLYLMIFVPNIVDKPLLLITFYILRTGLVNSTYPLQESILMDFVPKDERAWWKSLESVSQFGKLSINQGEFLEYVDYFYLSSSGCPSLPIHSKSKKIIVFCLCFCC